jgi:Holliday junction resolvase-like predicted endonuclease
MKITAASRTIRSNWHVATAAEAIAAAQFARLGFDVSVQYGANQPEYDLMIDDGNDTLKVSVKGSQNGGWGLSQSQLSKLAKQGKANYHSAADDWLARHKPRTILCLVQFKGAEIDAMPRVYIASPTEVATRLREASGGKGDTILWENYTRGPKAAGAGTIERIPDSWRLSKSRVDELLQAGKG